MKLSLVEPFGARPSAEERGELEAKEIADKKIITPTLGDAPTGESMKDSDDSELRRGFDRFIDFLAKQEKKPLKANKGRYYSAKAILIYEQVKENRALSEIIGCRYDKII